MKSCNCDYCLGSLIRRDFRQSKGGPEEMPHRKKGGGNKFCKKNKGPHVYDTYEEWQTYSNYRYRYLTCKCGKRTYSGQQFQRRQESTITVGGIPQTRTYWA